MTDEMTISTQDEAPGPLDLPVPFRLHPGGAMFLRMDGGRIEDGPYQGTTFGCTIDQSGLWVAIVKDGERIGAASLRPADWLAAILDPMTAALEETKR